MVAYIALSLWHVTYTILQRPQSRSFVVEFLQPLRDDNRYLVQLYLCQLDTDLLNLCRFSLLRLFAQCCWYLISSRPHTTGLFSLTGPWKELRILVRVSECWLLFFSVVAVACLFTSLIVFSWSREIDIAF